MSDLFKEIVPSILVTKKSVIDETNEKDYVPFIVNRALSNHYDCILFANAMNQSSILDPILQYHFYLNTIRGHKRPFRPWIKKHKDDDLNAIKEYYGYSAEKSMQALSLLSKDQIEMIKEQIKKGGTNDKIKRVNRGKAG